MAEKPNILILGGCGFIGRNFVHYLIKNELAGKIRIVDKTPPLMAWLNDEMLESFDNPIVEFCSSNLINPVSCKNAFIVPDSIHRWDLVVNCAVENRPNQSEAVYKEGIYKLSLNCAREAELNNIQHYVELSSGCMNSSEKTPITEDCKMDPWTLVAKQKHKIEKEFKTITNFNFTILRLPLVYGSGDIRYLMPRIIIAGLYKYLNETMKLLWTESLKLNTVHVTDVCAAIWFSYQNHPKTIGETYNIVDDSNSNQGSISNILAEIFNINIEYWGTIKSNLTKLNIMDTLSEINDKHMGPWAELCQKNNIVNTPLTPYMDEELLYCKHLNLDNTKFKSLGFQYLVPQITAQQIRIILNDYINQNLFPKSVLS